MKEKKRNVPVGLILFDCFLFTLFVILILNSILFFRCREICRNLIWEPVPVMRIMCYGSSENQGFTTVSANISVMDTSGNDVAVIERSWKGYFLAVDFTTASYFGKNFYFPYRIYGTDSVTSKHTSIEKKTGSKLRPYYLENKECLLFGSERSDYEREQLYALSTFSTSPLSYVMPSFSKKITVNLSRCEAGKTYGLFISEDGSLELREY